MDPVGSDPSAPNQRRTTMSVTIWDGAYYNGDKGDFPAGYTPDLDYYTQPDGQSWNNDISSLSTTDWLYVFDYKGYDRSGNYELLAPGDWNAAELAYYGLDNDISSFYYTTYVPV
jgi:hypothetical protein